ncbi:NADP-dependent oxidoreductase [Sphingomicrobium aestuariivivum]|uniref:NADP-dependent oxidoreductase n=1 Tax=Sphingomicrobium aestuariivivum TaxID=1582356 RepID=UPI001FD6F557|nr:NADP-dependent oxidoreductase [Sphingomicrobium aestuariivivum]MCJ8191662.1 NADP-dependent oxidoreductase [Sphingomicrobium aestuariivivum]
MANAWHLMQRPQGKPTTEDVALKAYDLPALEDGTIHVRNDWLSVDPYMRARMDDTESYFESFQIDKPMEGGAVGTVIASKAEGFEEGDKVLHMAGWRDEAVIPAKAANKLPDLGVEPYHFLANLGLTGGTAWFGLMDVASAKEGDTVFVSAAAGAVGSAVVQIAKAKGMTVIGSAGGPDKCDFVKGLGADACVDYKAGPILKGLKAALKEIGKKGIDVYFDNVGRDHLDAAFATANNEARFAECGMIDGYNHEDPYAYRYIMYVIGKRLQLKGFIFTDFMERMPEFYGAMGPMIMSGQVKSRETVHEGLESTFDAFLGLFSGANTGKMLVKL